MASKRKLLPSTSVGKAGMKTNSDDTIEMGVAAPNDLVGLLALYQYLNPDDPVLTLDDALWDHWQSILDNPALNYVVARTDGNLVSTCALTIVPNLTRSARPYGLIENVVTHPDYRKRGIGTQVLKYALSLAWSQNCYKVMLMTGSKQESTMRFYEQAGFVRGEKSGFVARPSS
jgi:GNAT superfamily N-acetyltransferase